jgi:hypothetical protein
MAEEYISKKVIASKQSGLLFNPKDGGVTFF